MANRHIRIMGSDMFVYFILAGNAVKIGKAKDPAKRMAELQTASAFNLKIIDSFACRSESHALHIESNLHRYCRHWRLRGEWFEHGRTKGLIASIRRYGGIDEWSARGTQQILAGEKYAKKHSKRQQRAAAKQKHLNISPLAVEMDKEFAAIMRDN